MPYGECGGGPERPDVQGEKILRLGLSVLAELLRERQSPQTRLVASVVEGAERGALPGSPAERVGRRRRPRGRGRVGLREQLDLLQRALEPLRRGREELALRQQACMPTV